MGSFRGGKGKRQGQRKRRRNANQDGVDSEFQWQNKAFRPIHERPALHESGDEIRAEEVMTPGEGDQQQQEVPSKRKRAREKIASKKERYRQAKRRRKEMHDEERRNTDSSVLDAPEEFLWQKYVEWVGEKMSNAEKKAEKWSKSQVYTLEETDELSLIEHVKEIVGPDYVSQGGFKKGKSAKPGVACIVLASSALRAVQLAKSVYDGQPVGKLFSKHIKIGTQREWLAMCCSKGLVPSAAGTAKRVQRLIEEGDMTLKHTVAILIDFKRDEKERNILDFETSKCELFDFLHQHARPLLNEGRMKLMLIAPRKPEQEAPGRQESPQDVGFVETS
eukprot:GFKZ01008666.1.p1 GENE.GFKZ01008666.1~~GFKZ01008666.1.p1  ORF type:complete len:334 (-),score=58.04 GFKZ01008666.1:1067-2068(-)